MFNQVVWIFVLGSGLLFATSGCSTVLTVAYLFHPEDVPAEYNELRGKHVVVVCKPIVELEFTDAGTARELADRIGANIRENVRGVKIISQQEVSRWLDENAWVDYATLGEAVDADIVVGIDLDHFSLHEGSTLYRGRTTVHMQVHDVNDDLIVFDKRMEDFTFQQTAQSRLQISPSSSFAASFCEFYQAVSHDAFMPMKAGLISQRKT